MPVDSTKRWSVAERALGLITALLVLATAFLSYKTASLASQKNTAQGQASDAQSGLANAKASFASASAALSSAQAALSSANSPTANSATTAASHPVRHQGRLVVSNTNGTEYSLNARNSQWSEEDNCCTDFQSYGGNSILLNAGTGGYTVMDDHAQISFATCNISGFSNAAAKINYDDLHVSENLCWLTTSGLLSQLKIVSLSPLTFDITTWDGKPS